MTRFWRIERRRFPSEAAGGRGSVRYGGRWTSPGLRVIHASTSLALAALEIFVNLDPSLSPADLVSIAGEIPETIAIARLDPKRLPAGWNRGRDVSLRRFGDEWLRRADTVALLVPSAVIPEEWNLLLNPAHADFAKLRFRAPQPFRFDERMFR